MKYEFKRDDALDFANRRGCRCKVRGDELQFSTCPYCGGGQHNDKDTFSINLSTGQYKCLRSSCGAEGNFVTLARDFDFSLGNDFDRYYSSKDHYRTFKTKEIKTKDHAVELMKKRGISAAVTRRYQLTVAEKLGADIITFPFFDEKGNLKFIKYRNMNFKKGVDKNKEWCEANCMPILFGMKQCSDFYRLIITEGQIDSLSVAEAGIENAVSVPTGAKGFTWVPYCWDWFAKFQELVVFGDFEQGKMSLLEELKKRFPGTVKAVRAEDYRGCKDANDILVKYGKEVVKDAVESATAIPVKRVKELADVESIDIYSIPKIKTGVHSIDKLIGGLYHSQVIVLTGKRGDGKSTFMGQLIVEALEQGKNVFAYSGELQDYFFKRWLDLQIAGSKNIVENTKPDGVKTHFLTNSTVDSINNWYRGQMYVYDNNVIEDDELTDFLKTIEKTIMQYRIHLVCIDNLMTALDVSMQDDLYRAQSKFVNKLCLIAKKYNVVIILVVHPRKNRFSGDDNDEVSGSADITNRVDVVMTYAKGKDIPPDQRVLKISKNRLTGMLTTKDGIAMYYDPISKRIADNESNFRKAYGWETDNDGFVLLDNDDPIPFK